METLGAFASSRRGAIRWNALSFIQAHPVNLIVFLIIFIKFALIKSHGWFIIVLIRVSPPLLPSKLLLSKIMKTLLTLLPMLVTWLSLSQLQARTISWSNLVGDDLFNSQGVALDASFTFEMGIFINDFVPTSSNINDWNTNWQVFDAAVVGDGWNVGAQFFASTAEQLPSGLSNSSFTTGGTFLLSSQAYLWVYHSKTVDFSSEWALVSDFSGVGNIADRWVFPSPPTEDQVNLSMTWSLADAETALFGALHSGVSEGGGEVTNQPSSFSLQTYQVPEPGSALLIASAGLLMLIRRRRLFR